jgi:transposase-like protein
MDPSLGVGGTEGGRSPTGVPPTPDAAEPGAGNANLPDPAVLERPHRRRFTVEYKLRLLREADQAAAAGQLGALLRREGLYSSHLTTWRLQRDQGTLAALAPRRRGPKPKPDAALVAEIERLQRENQRLAEKLRQAEAVIELQKKLSDLLRVPRTTPQHNGSDS